MLTGGILDVKIFLSTQKTSSFFLNLRFFFLKIKQLYYSASLNSDICSKSERFSLTFSWALFNKVL